MSKNYRIPGVDFTAKPVSLSRDAAPLSRRLYARAKATVHFVLTATAFLVAPWALAFLGLFFILLLANIFVGGYGAETPWLSVINLIEGSIRGALSLFVVPGAALFIAAIFGLIFRR